MLRRVLPLLALLLSSPLWSHAQPLPDLAPIRGVVVDETGRPVPSAVLTIRRQEDTVATAFWGAEARSDESGHFVVSDAEAGRYFVNVDAPGFAPLSSYALDWNTDSSPVRLQLGRLTRLRLRILAPDGVPLKNALVWIRLRAGDTSQTPVRSQTNNGGEVVVPDVIPGTTSLLVIAASGVWTQSGFDVSSSRTSPVDIRLTEGATLRIKASATDGTPLGGAALVLYAATPEVALRLAGPNADANENWALVAAANAPQALVTREGDGVVELHHLLPGRFSARLSLADYGVKPRDLVLEDGKSVEWLADFPVRSSATLPLSVVDTNGQPVPNALIALRLLPLASNGAFQNGELIAPELGAPLDIPFDSPGYASRVARTDAKGKLTLFPLRAGQFRLFASHPTPDAWLRAPVAPEGAPTDVVVSLAGPNTAQVQVPAAG